MTYFLIAATLVSGTAAAFDWRTGVIPNWLTVGTGIAGLIAHFVRGYLFAGAAAGVGQIGYSFGGALICGLVPVAMYQMKGIGGGDVKLFVAIGILCHPLGGLEAETYAFFAAALIAPARLAYNGVFFKTFGNALAMVLNPLRKKGEKREIPPEMLTWFKLAPCVFLGALATTVAHWDFS